VQEPKYLSADQFLLTTLIVKLAVMALLAIVLVRYSRFRRILVTERLSWTGRLVFVVGLGVPLTAGVLVRLLLNYNAADLTLEGAFLAGLIGGPTAGAIVGSMVALPPLVAGGIAALPFAVGCGLAGGGLREICPKDAIWGFSPFVFLSLHKRAWRLVRHLQVIDWQVILLLPPIALEILRQSIGSRYGAHQLFGLSVMQASSAGMSVVVVLGTVLGVAIPIKVWNSARIEYQLAEQEKLLMHARIEALAGQINPHFLFNTLTSISSLIRTQPDTARTLIAKLSSLLRRLLRSRDHFSTLRDELAAIDEYLDIETVRFGANLRVEKSISPDTLDVIVPSMLLQPLVENAIKHGISKKVGGGRVTIRSSRQNGRTVIEVGDDGLGMSEEALGRAMHEGIGLSNVNERLSVIYGAGFGLKLKSEEGGGTWARVEIPESALPVRLTA